LLISIYNNQSDLPISPPQVRALVREVLKKEKCKCDEVAIHFVDLKTICVLHEEYFNDPSPTDCISFPMDSSEEEGYRILGEVFVCPLAATEFARKNEEDPFVETSLYIIHGLLHLLGHDDMDEISEPLMRKAEARLLTHLKEKKLCLSHTKKTKTKTLENIEI